MPTQLHWTAGVHHDGSALYVSKPLPAFGETVTVKLRVPANVPIHRIYLRTVPDGESHYAQMELSEQDEVNAWWQGRIHVTMSRNPYRFKIITDSGSYYVNSLGVSQFENMDIFDFKLLADYQAPEWVKDSVFYHIFVDRFFNGDPSNDVKPGEWERDGFKTQMRPWGSMPLPFREGGSLDFFGGDLPGIVHKLDYLLDLGVNTVYLTPIFTARTNHRYDTIDFDNVDPHVGGNEALAELRGVLDGLNMRLVLDIVVNHVGWRHPWFLEAQANPNAPTAEYFTFYEHPDKYENWLGHNSLVKLNYRSEALREKLYGSPDSILRRWMHDPYRIDGWRLDVFHMMGRQREVRLEHKIGRQMRRVLKADNPNLYVYGEHSYDPVPHLQGDEVDGVMNYQGFSNPLRRWLTANMGPNFPVAYHDRARLPGEALAGQWTHFRASIPWVIAQQQYHMLSSHDITRLLTALSGSKSLLKLAVTLLMTYPGVPSIYYGDEIGIEGATDPDNRRCMEWDASKWDADLRAHHQKLIKLRRTAPALVNGGFQHLYAEGDLMVYQRQSPEQRLIVIGYRGEGELAEAVIPVWHSGIKNGAILRDLVNGGNYQVTEGAIRVAGIVAGTSLVLEEK